MSWSGLTYWVCVAALSTLVWTTVEPRSIDDEGVKRWATRFGRDLWEHLSVATYREKLQGAYDSHLELSVEEIDGSNLVEEIAKEVGSVMDEKVQAITRIAEVAEKAALDPMYDTALKLDGDPLKTLHVASSVDDTDPHVINYIDWSRKLEDTFKDNYLRDPTLSSQYFGSNNGVLRQFHAMKWPESLDRPDTYDARMQNWYTNAAASSKDLLILLDTSSNMTDLGKQVALTILDTLGQDDFVSVLAFSDEVKPVPECFEDRYPPALTQASTTNILQLKEAVAGLQGSGSANITNALIEAFDRLDIWRFKRIGSTLNQAIMLVTDNIPDINEKIGGYYGTMEGIFEHYNRPHKPYRVFTYLTGTGDMEGAKWMACENKGYFSQVSTKAEVKEEVLKYLNVLARPLVLYGAAHGYEDRPVRWTGVYGDVDEGSGYNFMTSVSTPVYNKKNTTTIDDLGLKPTDGVDPSKQVPIAEFLGVAGSDVPIKEIQNHASSYKMGGGGYSFVINNNGHILFHPVLKPIFKGYSTVDLADVELVNGSLPRSNNSDIFQMKKEMIDHTIWSNMRSTRHVRMTVQVLMDDVKRIAVRDQDYYYHAIPNTRFSLGIALPSNGGKHRVKGGIQPNNNVDVRPFFSDKNWRVHPGWVYCKYLEAQRNYFSQEENLLHFLERMATEEEFKLNGEIPPDCVNYLHNDDYDGYLNCTSHATAAILVSENWPSNYPDNFDKTYIIETSPGSVIYISFTDFEIEHIHWNKERVYGVACPYDWVMMQEGSGEVLMNKTCLSTDYADGPKRTGYTSKTNKVDIIFHTDSYENDKGFKLEWREIRNKKGPEDKEDLKELQEAAKTLHLCNEELIQELALDGKITKFTESRKEYFEQSGIYHSFVATRSGLTRWEDYENNDDNNIYEKLSPVSTKASEELWYQRAVNYHTKHPDSFVISTPLYPDIKHLPSYPVTASHAIYKEVGGRKALAAVVGVQMDFEKFATRFMEATNIFKNDSIEGYVVDNNGFVIITQDKNNVGKFFGEIEGAIFEILEDNKLFKKITSYDHQGVCVETEEDSKMKEEVPTKQKNTRPCDKELSFFELDESSFSLQRPTWSFSKNCPESDCERHFTISPIPHTNLVLIVADKTKTCPCHDSPMSVVPTAVDSVSDNKEDLCKMNSNSYRQRPGYSMYYHPQEEKLSLWCGDSGRL